MSLFALITLSIALLFQNYVVGQGEDFKNFIHPPEKIKYFTLGYKDMLTSSLWIRLVQDFHYCEGGAVEDGYYQDLDKEAAKRDAVNAILNHELPPSKCHLGWAYQMLNVMTLIEPNMYIAYNHGATMLSVSVDDREGARRIFERGIKNYPRDWRINYKAGYHYLWEVQSPERAAEVLNVAQLNGAPQWVAALSANLYNKVGKAQLAETILLDALERKPDPVSKKRILIRLRAVREDLKSKN